MDHIVNAATDTLRGSHKRPNHGDIPEDGAHKAQRGSAPVEVLTFSTSERFASALQSAGRRGMPSIDVIALCHAPKVAQLQKVAADANGTSLVRNGSSDQNAVVTVIITAEPVAHINMTQSIAELAIPFPDTRKCTAAQINAAPQVLAPPGTKLDPAYAFQMDTWTKGGSNFALITCFTLADAHATILTHKGEFLLRSLERSSEVLSFVAEPPQTISVLQQFVDRVAKGQVVIISSESHRDPKPHQIVFFTTGNHRQAHATLSKKKTQMTKERFQCHTLEYWRETHRAPE